MSEASSVGGRPPKGRLRVFDVVMDLYEAGKIDRYGGVAPAVAGEESGLSTSKARFHMNRLVEDGKLERVRGIGPNGPRNSYLPVGESDGN